MSLDHRVLENLYKSEIKDVLSIAIYARDTGDWDAIRDCFHSDAKLTTSWFTGTVEEFIAGSKKMKIIRHEGESQKHVITNPWVRLNKDRAIAEYDLVLYQRRIIDDLEFDFTTWSRSVAILEQRENRWKICDRTNIYEKDRMEPCQPESIPSSFYDSMDLDIFPKAIRYHCWRNARVGHDPAPNLVLKNSQNQFFMLNEIIDAEFEDI